MCLNVLAEDGLTCIAECPTDTYQSNNTCQPCSDTCVLFTQDSYLQSVFEDLTVGSVLLAIQGSDRRELGRPIFYEITSGNEDGLFSLDPASGLLSLASSLDYELRQIHGLTVRAAGFSGQSAETNVIVFVSDVNDNAPVFNQTSYTGSVVENTPPGVTILQVSATDVDSSPNSMITYSLTEDSDDFALDATSGVLTMRRSLDFETANSHTLTVTATDSGTPSLTSTAQVLVRVRDEDDVRPTFPEPALSVEVSESQAIGNSVIQLQAVDPDTQNLTYSLIEGNEERNFDIDTSTGLITLSSSLDFELTTMYLLVASVSDGINTVAPATVNISVIVLDENDNSPQFSADSYSTSLPEDTTAGSVVLTAFANDSDSTSNALVSYSISPAHPSFTINPTSGGISTTSGLDFEQQTSYQFRVVARDAGNPSLSSSALVTVSVSDVNDNPPVFRLSNITVQLQEGLENGTQVAVFEATDADSGSNAIITYRLQAPGDVPFQIHPTTGFVHLAGSLDYETETSYLMEVVASDQGVPSLSATASLSVEVLDENDNQPEFDQAQYTVSISETQAVGSPVIQVTATDRDSGANADIQYSITAGNLNDAFQIDQQNGSISLASVVDFEQTTLYTLTVTAVNFLASNQLASSISVTINVLDVNEFAPVFTQDLYQRGVRENGPPGVSVLSVRATDQDTGLSGEVSYRIMGGDEREAFDVLSNGTLVTRLALDREQQAVYNLTVLASDSGLPSFSDTTQVLVTVLDENDSPPLFLSSSYSASLTENVAAGTDINLTPPLIVTDADDRTTPNAEIRFSIVSGDPARAFEINTMTGQIQAVGDIDFEQRTRYELTISATDNGVPALSSTALVVISIQDTNDNTPQVLDAPSLVLFTEGQDRASVLANVTVTDADSLPLSRAAITLTGPATLSGQLGSLAIASATSGITVELQDNSRIIQLTGSFSPEQLTSLIRTLEYVNFDLEPDAANRSITVLISDGEFQVSFQVVVLFQLINDNTPVVDLDSSSPGQGFAVSFVEEGSPVRIAGEVVVSDGDGEMDGIASVQVSLLDSQDGALEGLLVVGPETSPFQVQYLNNNDTLIFTASTPASFESVQSLLSTVAYFNDADEPSSPLSRTIHTTVSDGELTSTPAVSIVSILLTNDPPSISLSSSTDSFVNFIEGEGAVALSSQLTLSDSDDTELVNATVTLLDAPDGTSEMLVLAASSVPSLSVSTTPHSIEIQGPAALRDFSSVLRSVSYNNVLQSPSPVLRRAVFAVSDGTSVSQATAFISFDLVNDPPILDLNGPPPGSDLSVTFLEGSPAIPITSSGLTLNDVDNPLIDLALIQLSSSPDGVSEGISLPPTVDPALTIMASQTLIAIRGPASSSIFASVLASVQYFNTAEEPAEGERVVRFVVSDGELNSTVVTSTVSVVTINDSPVLLLNNGTVYDTAYIEESSSVAVVDLMEDVVLFDNDNTSFSHLLVLLRNVLDGNAEVLGFSDPSQDGSLSLQSGAGMEQNSRSIRFQFSAESSSASNFRSLIASLSYRSTASEPTAGTRDISISISDGLATSVTQQSRVSITLLNDNAPVFQRFVYQGTVPENVMDVSVTSVMATDADTSVGPFGEQGTVRYQILSGNEEGTFRIDPATGEISVQVPRDRETSSVNPVLTVQAFNPVPLSDPSLSYPTTFVIITVADVNDNSPQFVGDPYSFQLTEHAQLGTVVGRVLAEDDDAGSNSQLQYTISQGNVNSAFTIDRDLGEITVANSEAVDREVMSTMVLSVTATDGGDPQTSNTTLVSIVLLDVNDNAPVFSQASYSQTVSELTPANTALLTVSAMDADAGLNGNVSYTLNGSESFSIDSISGVIRTLTQLDRESQSTHNLLITARDLGQPSLSQSVGVVISVLDENDNAPAFQQSLYSSEILEGVPVGQLVGTVVASDADAGSNAEVSYSIVETVPFSVAERSGVVSTSEVLDREAQSMYNFTMRATDAGVPQMSAFVTFLVSVRDANDNVPVFTEESYSVSVAENVPLLSPLVTVEAMDSDDSSNSELSYSLSGGEGLFQVDSSTGQVFTVGSLDYELQAIHILDLVVSDNGRPPLSSSATLTVNVTDQNDNAPVFDTTLYQFSVAENILAGVVGIVSASDQDDGANAEILYNISDPNLADVVFSIDPVLGEIRLVSSLDRESVAAYNFTVVATDRGQPTQSATNTVVVSVDDRNDNSPVFTEGSYSTEVPETTGIGSVLLTVGATDADIGANSNITYAIISGNSPTLFSLDGQSGDLTLTGSLDAESAQSHVLQVRASDSGNPVLSVTTSITITVTDINDVPIQITAPSTSVTFIEEGPAVSLAPDLSVADGDVLGVVVNATVELVGGQTCCDQLTLASGSELLFQNITFDVVDNTFLVLQGPTSPAVMSQVLRSVQYTNTDIEPQAGSLSAIFTVSDGAFVDQLNVIVTVSTVNDNAPVVTLDGPSTNFSTVFIEGSPNISAVGSVAISDADSGQTTLQFISVVLVNALDGEMESLSADPFGSVSVLPAEGQMLLLNGPAPIQHFISTLASLRYVNRDDNPTQPFDRLIEVTASDGGLLSEASYSFIEIVAINDPPFLQLSSVGNFGTTFREGSAAVRLSSVNAAITDPDSPNLQTASVIISNVLDIGSERLQISAPDSVTVIRVQESEIRLTGPFSTTMLLAALRSATYLNNATSPTAGVREVIFRVSDGEFSAVAFTSVSVILVNDPPSLDLNGPLQAGTAFEVPYTEGGLPVLIAASDASIDDSDNENVTSLSVTIVNPLDGGSEVLAHASLSDDSGITSTFSNGRLVLSGEASLTAYVSLLRSIAYVNSADEPFGRTRQLVVTCSDGESESLPAVTLVQFILVNDPPVVILDEGGDFSAVYREESPAVPLVNPRSAGISDPDSPTLPYITLTISNLLDGDAEIVNFTDPVGNLTVDRIMQSAGGENVAYVLSYPEPATVSVFNQLLLSLTYQNTAEEPNATLDRIVTVIVSDGQLTSQPVLSSVSIQLVDDNEPLFTAPVYMFNVSEAAASGTVLGSVQASDLDMGDTFLYQLSSQGAPFTLDSTTGVLTVSGDIDREIQDEYEMVVRLTRTTPPFSLFSDQALVIVTVTDINDNAPVFNQTQYSLQVREDIATNTIIDVIEATDEDSGSNALLTYSLSGTDTFEIDQIGNLFNVVSLDRERNLSYEFTVSVRDNGSPSLTSVVPVSVTVLDVNDEVPQFQQASYFTQVVENTPTGTSLIQLAARDGDTGSNAQISFSLEPADTQFILDSVSGVISVANTLIVGVYNFTATARDGGSPALSSTAQVTIDITSFNSTLPLFTQPLYEASITENSPEGVSVVTVFAIDPITGAPVSYSLSQTSFFVVSPSSGLISTSAVSLDREMQATHQFQVTATSSDGERRGVASVSVRVLDANDFPPVFAQSEYVFNVVENNDIGDVVGAVFAVDNQDIGTNADIASYMPSNANFSINSAGIMMANAVFDREDVDTYMFTVRALDSGIPALTGSVSVTVSILDSNDQPPLFTQSVYAASVSENEPIRTSVLTVRAEDADLGSNAAVSYSTNSTTFAVDPQSGVVSTLAELDFETAPDAQIEVFIVARDSGLPAPLSSVAMVIITLLDVDDTGPMFTTPSYSIDVSEGQIHPSILQVVATDSDSPPENPIMYQITSGNDNSHFAISQAGVISVVSPLDRETFPQHVLMVRASNLDAEGSTVSSTATVTVDVLDINDNPPSFLGEPYSFSISEAADTGILGTLSATDEDSAPNANIGGFAIVGGNEESLFSLHPQSGILQLSNTSVNSLDRERVDRYDLTVVVSDNGSPPLTSTTNVTITILDVNDEEPSFTQQSYNTSVGENATIGSFVFSASGEVSDTDLGSNAEITFSFLERNADFSISPGSGIVTVSGSLDFESQQSYSLVLLAADGGTPALTGSAVLSINILDEDDQPLVFDSDNYAGSVSENVPPGTPVLLVQASDPDTVQGNPITYSLQQSSGTVLPFSVDSQTGNITVTGPLDREIVPRYVFVVLASNTPGVSVSATVVVEIRDVNDVRPQFDSASQTFQLPESLAPGFVIAQLTASDNDEGSSGEISRYNLEGAPANFVIDPLNGTLSLAVRLDYEAVQMYMFNVIASDGGTPSLTGQTAVTISVVDFNDNPPQFSMDSYQKTVSENLPVGGVVFTAVTQDADSGANSRVTYTLAQPSAEFSIDPQSGVVRTVSQLFIGSYTLTIVASDGGTPSLSSMATLVVMVMDANDPPSFSQPVYRMPIPEDRALNSLVVQVVATDPDSGVNAELTYSIDPQDQFSIDASNGRITVSQSLDFESQEVYNLRVYVSDNGIPSLSASATLVVTITDTNDNDPVFSETSYSATLPENSLTGEVVLVVNATDADSTSNADITYSITQDSSPGSLTINPLSGSVLLIGSLDYESVPDIRLVVQARDGGTPSRSTTVPVTVTVSDVDDNPPVFSQSTPYLASVSEAARVGSTVTRTVASDRDEGGNADIRYTLVNSTQLPFSMNSQTGDVLVTGPGLDREDLDQYSLTVEASNPFSPLFTATANVLVTVLDANDNRPAFDLNTLQVTVSESTPTGTSIGRVSASDADIGNNSVITYTFDPPSTLLSVDPSSGEILVQSGLDFETNPTLDLTVVASDLGTPPLSLAANYRVSITNVNDEVPVFTSTVTQFTYREGSSPIRLGIGISLSDADQLPLASASIKLYLGRVGSSPPSDDFIQVDFSQSGSQGLSVISSPDCINITGQATVGAYLSLLRLLEFGSTAGELVSTTRMVQLEVSDGEFSSTPLVISVDIQTINDNNPVLDLSLAAEGLDYQTSFTEGDPFVVITAGDVTLTDIDSDILQSVRVNLTNPIDPEERLNSFSFGTVQVMSRENGLLLDLIGPASASDFELALQTVVYENSADEPSEPQEARVVSFVANDGQLESISASTTITISLVNDAPVIRLDGTSQDDLLTYLETDTSLSLVSDALVISDVDSELLSFVNVTIVNFLSVEDQLQVSTAGSNVTSQFLSGTLLLTGPATAEQFTSVLQTLRYVNTFVNTDQSDQLQSKSIQFSVSDGFLTSQIATAFLDFEGVNDPPIVDLNGPISGRDISSVFSEGDESVNITSPLLTLMDEDSPNLLSVVVSLSDTQDSTSETLAATLSIPGLVISFDTTNNQLTVQGPSSVSNFELVLRSLVYRNTAPDPTPGRRVATVVANDGEDFSSPVFAIIMVVAVNDPPQLALEERGDVFVEEGGSVLLVSAGTGQVSDSDSQILSSLSVRLGNALDGAMESVFVSEDVSGLVMSRAEDSEAIVFTFSFTLESLGTVQQFSLLLDSLSYNNTSPEPQAGTRLANISVSDGLLSSNIVTVQIPVVLVNDNPPTFATLVEQVSVVENSPFQMSIFQAVASDVDADSVIMYSLGSSGPFEISQTTGVVSVRSAFDRETQDLYNVTITASDGISTVSMLLVVVVTDVNDNPPVFSRSTFEASVDEDEPVGTSVLTLTASDADIGSNAELVYFITAGNTQRVFSINSTSGELLTSTLLDFEQVESYNLSVTARDTGSPRLTSTVSVLISVRDVNDNAPVFSPSQDTVTRPEDTPVTSLLYAARAMDADVDTRLAYRLTSGQNELFSVNTSTGEVLLAGELDFELVTMHVLVIEASDGEFMSEFTLMVVVLDVDDNPPMFLQDMYSVSIPEDARVGSDVLAGLPPLNISDLDTGSNAAVEFPALPDDLSNQFAIFPLSFSAQLLLTASLDRETTDEYLITILAQNPTNPLQNDTALVLVTVTDVNDSPPVFERGFYNFSVLENSAGGTMVGQINSTDADIDENAEITYNITLGDDLGMFDVLPTGEIILVSDLLDYELTPQFTLTVQATDGGSPSLSADSTVLISVLDVNDNQPVFSDTDIGADLVENAPPSTTVAILNATDIDSGANAIVTYSIHPDNASRFSIDANGALMTTNLAFDFETDPTELTVLVLARDGGSPSLMSSATVTVTLQDQNEFSPVFNMDLMQVNVSESVPPFSTILELDVTDADAGSAGVILYALTDSNTLASPLSINNATGEVFLTTSLDREAVDMYIVTIQASNPLVTPSLSSMLILTINVLDINDNAPVFAQREYTGAITTSFNIGDVVLTVTAQDADIGPNGDIEYSITDTNGLFNISSTSGTIVLASELTTTGIFTFTVSASDQGDAPLSSSAAVSVSVIQPTEVRFSQEGAGFLLDQASATMRDFGFFVDSFTGAGGSVSARLGNVTATASYDTRLPEAVTLRGVVTREEVWPDEPSVAVYVQVADELGGVRCSPVTVVASLIPDDSLRALLDLTLQVSGFGGCSWTMRSGLLHNK